jgi:hypothetical protein
MPELFDQPTGIKLARLLTSMEQGELLIPDFQRTFVWKDEQRLNLLRSVADGLPLGAILVWRTFDAEVDLLRALGPFPLPERPARGPWTYLIDGLQRLSTLFTALRPLPLQDAESYDEDEERRRPILIDLTAEGDERFVLARRNARALITQVPAWVLLSNKEVYRRQQALWKEDRHEEAEALEVLSERFKEYALPVMPMTSDRIEDVTRAFIRINSGGTPMSEAHLTAALAYRRLPLASMLGPWEEELRDQGWGLLDRDCLLDLLKLRFGLDVYRANPRLLVDCLAKTGDKLPRVIESSKAGLAEALWLLRSVGVYGGEALPYRFQALLLADALRRVPLLVEGGEERKQQIRAMWTWFWQTTFTEYFTGATGRDIAAMHAHLCERLRGNGDWEFPVVSRQLRHQRWGAVRTRARALSLLVYLPKEQQIAPMRLLGELGAKALRRIHPKAPAASPGSWIVAHPGEMEALQRALEKGVDRDALPNLHHQFADGALDALRRGAVAEAVAAQTDQILAQEGVVLEIVGLTLAPEGGAAD